MTKKKRFYDQHPTLSVAVESMMLFPEEMQEIVARGFATIAERDCKAAELLQQFKSLGAEMILALYKSKGKKRSYDQNPVTHQAMNYLMIMDDDSRLFLASKIIELVNLMKDYLRLCKTYETAPQKETAQAISEAYVERGPQEAKAFLMLLDQEFNKRMQDKPTTADAPSNTDNNASPTENLKSGNTGMKIRGDRQ